MNSDNAKSTDLLFSLEKNLEQFSKSGNTEELFSNFKKILITYS